MFIGHYSAALVAAAHPKAPPLGTLFVAAQLVDFGFAGLVLTGVEQMRITPGISTMNPLDLFHMPYTHSLLGSLAWAVGFALILKLWRGDWTTALIGGAVVLSHWFLDLAVHIPDLTLAGGADKLGLALWNRPLIEMPLELGIAFGALWFYAARSRSLRANAAMPLLAAALFLVQIYNWFGPAPDAVVPMVISMLLAFAIVAAIAAWLGRSRETLAWGEMA